MKFRLLPWVIALFSTALITACSKKTDHAGHDHGTAHVHGAPHGGVLVEVGAHQYNLEFVHDAAAGKLTAYVLGGHAEDFVRIGQPALELALTQPGPARSLTLLGTVNPATGEKAGDTSQFEASADWLKTTAPLVGRVTRIDIRGTVFSDIAFTLGPAHTGAH